MPPTTRPPTAALVPLVERAPRAATGAFGALLAIAAVTYAVAGRAQWFFQDEWVFLAERDATSASGLLDPHSEHWVTAPLLAYRVEQVQQLHELNNLGIELFQGYAVAEEEILAEPRHQL